MFGLLGLTPGLFALFVVFGFMVGVFFGFFGMGGSFLVTPALLILGYPAPVAIGSSMTFVFGTAVIATLKHHDTGQVDYRLGALMFVGSLSGSRAAAGWCSGWRRSVSRRRSSGSRTSSCSRPSASLFTRSALNGDDEGDDEAGDGDASDERRVERRRRYPAIAQKVQSYNIPPMMTLADGQKASLWTISGVSAGVGVISGFLGVGGGFVRMPAIYYVIGTSLAAAVGTSLFTGLLSGGVGAFTYGRAGVIDLGIVTALLLGSALGARSAPGRLHM